MTAITAPKRRSAGDLVRAAINWHRPLMIQVIVMTGLMVVSFAGALIDDRIQNGVSPWDKPLKFAVAFVAYGTTLAWMLHLPHKARRFTWWVGTIVALSGTADVAVVAMQGARGTFSHFNTNDVYGQITQNVFSIGVPILMLANMILAITLIVQRVGDKATALAVRLSAFFSIAGMGLGLLISLNPHGSSGQYIDGNGDTVTLAISHSVGTRDDAPVMPFLGWNSTAGDLRIPHFVGMHGMQVMLLAGLLLAALAGRVAWLRDERTRRAVIGVVGLGYAGITALVTWQALRGQSLIHPDAETWTALGAIAGVSALLFLAAMAVGKSRARRSASRLGAKVPSLV